MDFEETLSALQGLIGRRVAVSFTGMKPTGAPAYLGEFRGVLTRGRRDRVAESPDETEEAMFFSLDDDPRAGVFLYRNAFEGAQAHGGGSVLVRMAGVEVAFEPLEE